jgi:hypothetical protein
MTLEEIRRSLAHFGPELALTAGLLLVILVDALGPRGRGAVHDVVQGLPPLFCRRPLLPPPPPPPPPTPSTA